MMPWYYTTIQLKNLPFYMYKEDFKDVILSKHVFIEATSSKEVTILIKDRARFLNLKVEVSAPIELKLPTKYYHLRKNCDFLITNPKDLALFWCSEAPLPDVLIVSIIDSNIS